MKTLLIFLVALSLFISSTAQTSLNQTDSRHLKQGKWIGNYPDGTIRYEGYFNDDKPVGEWKRYHENGKLKAILIYILNSDKVKAQLFDPDGSLLSGGNFIGTLKDSIWTYFDNTVIVARESYTNGLKNGMSVTYYPDGKSAVENQWINGKLNGVWHEFYPSGEKKSETHYLNGKRQGESRIYFDSGQIQIEGVYDNDQYSGAWKFFNTDGTMKLLLEYKDGILQNPEASDSLQLNEFKAFDQAKGKIKDPGRYRDNPEEYLRK
jgi:antitoxin component YwqK of YwqJK toxin-antitoxin module